MVGIRIRFALYQSGMDITLCSCRDMHFVGSEAFDAEKITYKYVRKLAKDYKLNHCSKLD